MDTELDRLSVEVTPVRPSSTKRSVFGSIERGMDRIKMILTPKKRAGSGADGPRKVKVSHTRGRRGREAEQDQNVAHANEE